MRRLDAFTILELLVVMVVSALLFGMAYSALRMVQRQQQGIARKSALLGQISTWQTALAADFYTSTIVTLSNDQVRCQRRDGEVTYLFQDSTLVREQGELVDTFRLPIRQCTYFWQGQERTSGLIDELTLLGVAAQDTFYLQADHHYAAQQLVALPASPSSSIIP
jgi:prepilin-type N-terminal cleavage/methylation domain-containing protein